METNTKKKTMNNLTQNTANDTLKVNAKFNFKGNKVVHAKKGHITMSVLIDKNDAFDVMVDTPALNAQYGNFFKLSDFFAWAYDFDFTDKDLLTIVNKLPL